MEQLQDWGRILLGLGQEGEELGVVQMGLRAVIVFVVTVALVRLGKKRFFGRATAFDVILGIMLGSIVSRAVTGNAPLVPALSAAAVLLLLHWAFSAIALRWHAFGGAIKGRSHVLVREGRLEERHLRRAHMTEYDLREALRSRGVARLDEVAEARLERSGEISVIKARGEPKVVEVDVRDGVQTVRIEIAG